MSYSLWSCDRQGLHQASLIWLEIEKMIDGREAVPINDMEVIHSYGKELNQQRSWS